jgi:hypothetical protein
MSRLLRKSLAVYNIPNQVNKIVDNDSRLIKTKILQTTPLIITIYTLLQMTPFRVKQEQEQFNMHTL